MTYMKEKLLASVLNFKHSTLGSGASTFDLIELGAVDGNPNFKIKNMCAKVPEQLDEKVTNTASWLGMSKRDFIEMAVINAIDEAEKLADEYNAFDRLDKACNDKSGVSK